MNILNRQKSWMSKGKDAKAIFIFHIKGMTLQNECLLGANWTFLNNKRFTRIGQSWYKHLVKKEFLKLIFAKTINNFFFGDHWVTIRNTQHKVYFAYLFFNFWKSEKLKKCQLSIIGTILYSSEFTMVYPKTPFVVWVTKG
jgi:hypothetical protein